MLLAIFVLIGGPTLAYLALSLGCGGDQPLLGVACGHNAVLSFVALSLFGWVALGAAAVVWSMRRRA